VCGEGECVCAHRGLGVCQNSELESWSVQQFVPSECKVADRAKLAMFRGVVVHVVIV
jgi:hypothetical protein